MKKRRRENRKRKRKTKKKEKKKCIGRNRGRRGGIASVSVCGL
jgi:hypothetical protein